MTCVYCNVLTSKITAEATCDRLSCYPTRTFRAWAYLAGFEEYNSRTDPFGKRSTSLYARWTFMARYLPNLCHRRAMSCLSSPVSAVYAWNAWDHDPPFGEENGCILWLGLSYGSPSKNCFTINCCKENKNMTPFHGSETILFKLLQQRED